MSRAHCCSSLNGSPSQAHVTYIDSASLPERDPISELCQRGWLHQFSIISCTPAAATLLHAAGATAAASGLAINPSQLASHASGEKSTHLHTTRHWLDTESMEALQLQQKAGLARGKSLHKEMLHRPTIKQGIPKESVPARLFHVKARREGGIHRVLGVPHLQHTPASLLSSS